MLVIFIMLCIFTACLFVFGIGLAFIAIRATENKSTYFVLSFAFIMLATIFIYCIFCIKPSIKPENYITTNTFEVQKNWKIDTIETRETSPDKLVIYIEDEPVGTIPLNKVEICDIDEVTYNKVNSSISNLKISEDTAIKLGIMSEKVKVNAEN